MWLGSKPVPAGGPKLIDVPSPNFGPRKNGALPSLIVIHYTAMGSFSAALQRLCDPEFEVSAHYLIGQDGQVAQMVAEENRAWHAGAGAWGRCCDVNSASVGIELCNRGNHPFPAPQVSALIDLVAQIRMRWAIPPERVIGHSDMAPLRKQDPGRLFDWSLLADAGHAVFRGRDHAEIYPFDVASQKFGYDMENGCDAVFDAFRQRFRPKAVGPMNDDDIKIMSDLAQTWPVDAGVQAP